MEVEIRTLIADNEKLSRQVGTLLKEKLQTAQRALTNDGEQEKEVEEMRRQVALITKVRFTLFSLLKLKLNGKTKQFSFNELMLLQQRCNHPAIGTA